MSALPPKADMFSFEIDVCFVPIADINHLPVQRGRYVPSDWSSLAGVEIRPSTPWYGSLQSAIWLSYLISQVALWLTMRAGRPPTVS